MLHTYIGSAGSQLDTGASAVRPRRLSEAATLTSMEDLISEAAASVAALLPEHLKR